MKINVLGTGDLWSSSYSSSFLIDESIIIDMPNGNYKNLIRQKLNSNNIKHVLITHFHADHYFDIPFYLLGKTKNKVKDVTNIYCSKDGIIKIKKLFLLGFPHSLFKVLSRTKINFITSEAFKIEKYNVEKLKVNHGYMKPSFGYIFEKNNVSVGFTGDSSYCISVKNMASICNYLFLDCAKKEGNDKHMGVDNIIHLAKKYPKCKFYPTHMGENARKILLKNKLKNIHVLSDGEVIKIKM